MRHEQRAPGISDGMKAIGRLIKTVVKRVRGAHSYGFRREFLLAPNYRIDSPNEREPIGKDPWGADISLISSESKPIKESSHLGLLGREYTSQNSACVAVRHARQVLLHWAIKNHIGVIVPTVAADCVNNYYAPVYKLSAQSLTLRVQVYSLQSAHLFLTGTLQLISYKSFHGVGRCLADLVQHKIQMCNGHELAAELIASSDFEGSIRGRFLALMVALETLINGYRRKRPDKVQRLIDKLIGMVDERRKGLGDDVYQSLKGGLGDFRRESVRQRGRSLARDMLGRKRYWNMDAARFFDTCYRLRNEMVHGGAVDNGRVLEAGQWLREFARDLWVASWDEGRHCSGAASKGDFGG